MARRTPLPADNWADRSTFECSTCLAFVEKGGELGRCRRHAPTVDGWPVVYLSDFCLDHRIDAEKL